MNPQGYSVSNPPFGSHNDVDAEGNHTVNVERMSKHCRILGALSLLQLVLTVAISTIILAISLLICIISPSVGAFRDMAGLFILLCPLVFTFICYIHGVRTRNETSLYIGAGIGLGIGIMEVMLCGFISVLLVREFYFSHGILSPLDFGFSIVTACACILHIISLLLSLKIAKELEYSKYQTGIKHSADNKMQV